METLHELCKVSARAKESSAEFVDGQIEDEPHENTHPDSISTRRREKPRHRRNAGNSATPMRANKRESRPRAKRPPPNGESGTRACRHAARAHRATFCRQTRCGA